MGTNHAQDLAPQRRILVQSLMRLATWGLPDSDRIMTLPRAIEGPQALKESA